jgi:hypothetical protein
MPVGMHKLAVVALTAICGIAQADSTPKRKVPTVSGEVVLGTVKVTGALTAHTVTRTMSAARSRLLACYRKGLTADPKLEATATAMFAIGPTGKVQGGTVSLLAMPDAAVEKCVVGVIATLRFAKPTRGKVEVEYPLTFDPIPSGAFASITGTGDISSGFDDKDIYGGLLGNEAGEMQGGFGIGSRGTGPGGGGTGWGTIGTGRYGTIGRTGTGSGYGYGGRPGKTPAVTFGQQTVTGDLDKAIIRRYMKRNAQKLLYCYEKELVTKKTLAGTVRAQFTIRGDGNVVAASADGTLKDAAVRSCVTKVIQAIQFPKPKGGGAVIVVYPLTFRPPGK